MLSLMTAAVPLHGRLTEAGAVQMADGDWLAVVSVRGNFTKARAERIAQAMALAAEDADV